MPLDQKPQPFFTLRGHQVGVTALTHVQETLVSGDEAGNIYFWSLTTFRRVANWQIAGSKIQSLKAIKLIIKSTLKDIIVCQSRDDGVKLVACGDITCTDPSSLIIKEFPTYESLYSRGDALSIDDTSAILAYPSGTEANMITIRYLGPDSQIVLSGNAVREQKGKQSKLSAVFDIKLIPNSIEKDSHYLFAGYEDGMIVIFLVDSKLTRTIPELNVTGLKVDAIRQIDLGLEDFVSSFDVSFMTNDFVIVCGSSKKEVIFCNLPVDLKTETAERLALRRQGISAVTIRQDSKLVAIASWDHTIRLYSMKSRSLLAVLDAHLKQIQSIMFVKRSSEAKNTLCCASLDGTISLYELY